MSDPPTEIEITAAETLVVVCKQCGRHMTGTFESSLALVRSFDNGQPCLDKTDGVTRLICETCAKIKANERSGGENAGRQALPDRRSPSGE